MIKHFYESDILLPKSNFEKWSVVACDQFTSEPEYWDKATQIANGTPSALNIVLPEAHLDGNDGEKIAKINKNMYSYLENGVFSEHKNSFVYVERTQSDGRIRCGIVGMIKLSDYDYKKGSSALIRATEATVLERIPPRVNIRRDAPLELPHILLLVDDPDMTVIAPLKNKKNEFSPAYSFDLMLGGGHIEGYFTNENTNAEIHSALDALIEKSEDKLLFAVGDGNHSLASAKECAALDPDNDAAQYALCEIVNIHDEAIEFEPIYRVLFGCDAQKVISDFIADNSGDGEKHSYQCIFGNETKDISVKASAKLPVGTLQVWLDEYLKAHSEIKIDYIHGEDTVKNLCRKENTLGFIFDGMKKDELFDAIRLDGSLPRKTFSMGHAADKRYYVEARKIK
ncbi:MAG: DUF1015 domain-containing protein [Clostridia bacterium]|nr:DUF1015 domain-containing protein [Clostridia bacterium]